MTFGVYTGAYLTRTNRDRAIEALHDYLIWLRDRGDHSDEGKRPDHGSKATLSERRAASDTFRDQRQIRDIFSEQTSRTAVEVKRWALKKERSWKAAGRINRWGYLKGRKPKPFTLDRIARAFPGVSRARHIAILITVGGRFKNRMEQDDIIRIVDEAVKMRVRHEIAAVFSGLSTLRDPEPMTGGSSGRKPMPNKRRRCPKCNGKLKWNPEKTEKICPACIAGTSGQANPE